MCKSYSGVQTYSGPNDWLATIFLLHFEQVPLILFHSTLISDDFSRVKGDNIHTGCPRLLLTHNIFLATPVATETETHQSNFTGTDNYIARNGTLDILIPLSLPDALGGEYTEAPVCIIRIVFFIYQSSTLALLILIINKSFTFRYGPISCKLILSFHKKFYCKNKQHFFWRGTTVSNPFRWYI